MKNYEVKQLAQDLNTSTSDWNNVARPVLDEYTETTPEQVEDFLRAAIEKRDAAARLVEILADEADRLYKTPAAL